MTKVYEDEEITLYLDNCLNVELPERSVDAVITGPPYIPEDADERALLQGFISNAYKQLKEGGVLCTTSTDLRKGGTLRLRHLYIISIAYSCGFSLFDYHIWDKGFKSSPYRIAFSHILGFRKGNKLNTPHRHDIPDILSAKAIRYGEYRDANAPQVTRELIRHYTNSGDTVLDPFAGSGTTCLESRNLQRKSIGIELDPNIMEVCIKNVMQTPLPCLEPES